MRLGKLDFRTQHVALLVIGLALAVALVVSVGALADYAGLPRFLPPKPNNNPSTPQQNHLRLSVKTDSSDSGANDFQDTLSFLVYSNRLADNSAYIDLTSSSFSNTYNLRVFRYQVDDSGVQTTGSYNPNSGYSNESISGISGIFIPRDSFTESKRFNGYYVAGVTMQLQDTSPGKVMTFDINRTDQSSKFSVRGANSNEGDTSDNGNPLNPNRSLGVPLVPINNGPTQYETIDYRFGAPCDSDKNKEFQRRIFWRGADSGTSINDNKVISVKIYPQNGDPTINVTSDAGSSNNVYASSPIQFKQGVKYLISFDNVKDTSASPGNTIVVWAPFDSAEYDRDCNPTTGPPTPSAWDIKWKSNDITDGNGDVRSDDAGNAGDLAHPEYTDSPQPGESFNFVHKAYNKGERVVDNRRWTKVCSHDSDNGNGQCHGANNNSPNDNWYLSDSYLYLNMDYSPYSEIYGATAHQAYAGNSQVVNQTSTLRGGSQPDIAKGTQPGNELDSYNPNDPAFVNGGGGSRAIAASDGGAVVCSQRTITPSTRKATFTDIDKDNDGKITTQLTDWNDATGSITSPNLCVRVPFYYNLTPSVTLTGTENGTIQQGSPPTIVANISQPSSSGGRNHTNSQSDINKEKGLLLMTLNPGEPEPSNKTAEALSSSKPEDWCAG
ncbi:MAG: hypothetical protein Q7T74_03325, partial [Candidatus Saccharibacteria bacterium]|nr:hypothetical protein [Candidatus Saccharibacteria bacterium]